MTGASAWARDPMNLTDLSQYFFSGLTIGCIYALVALGFVIIANVTQVYNFAQGEYVMIGAMVVAGGSSRGWSMAVLVPLASVVVGAVAFVQERLDRRSCPQPGEPAHASSSARSAWPSSSAALALMDLGRGPATGAGVPDRHVRACFGAHLTHQSWIVWVDDGAQRSSLSWCCSATPPRGGRCARARSTRRRCGCSGSDRGRSPPGVRAQRAARLASSARSPCRSRSCGGTAASPSDSIAFIAAAIGGFTSPAGPCIAGLALGVIESMASGLISSQYRSAYVYGVLVVYLLRRGRPRPATALLRRMRARWSSRRSALEVRDASPGRHSWPPSGSG